eukprot:SAG11_NODE_17000_length_531_cov_1.125000_1_plen_53_part_10
MNPDLIYVSISGFGQSGVRPASPTTLPTPTHHPNQVESQLATRRTLLVGLRSP